MGGSGIVYALLGLFIADQIQYLRTTEVHKRSFGLVIIMLVVKGAGKEKQRAGRRQSTGQARPGQARPDRDADRACVCFFFLVDVVVVVGRPVDHRRSF